MKKTDTPLMPADEAPFAIRPYLKVDLARLYSPGLADRTAMNRLNRWIRHNHELHDRLYSGREGKNDICFSLRQVRLLVEYLGEP
ncbi:DUF4248 domain-containing protein [Caecibacteroides pullorum]|nr:DUF4248 domain-containing protein [Caecibacteroides pullorum]